MAQKYSFKEASLKNLMCAIDHKSKKIFKMPNGAVYTHFWNKFVANGFGNFVEGSGSKTFELELLTSEDYSHYVKDLRYKSASNMIINIILD
jgi:hypothetical protein